MQYPTMHLRMVVRCNIICSSMHGRIFIALNLAMFTDNFLFNLNDGQYLSVLIVPRELVSSMYTLLTCYVVNWTHFGLASTYVAYTKL